jgi:hypothetical protein
MLNATEQRRFDTLRNRQAEGLPLSSVEIDEIAIFVKRIESAEDVYLGPANARLRAENAATAERVIALNALINREERFVARLQATLAELHEERNAMIAERLRLVATAPNSDRL